MLGFLCFLIFFATTQADTVLITGASSGIGESAARFLSSQGHNIVLCARRGDKLDAIVQDILGYGGRAIGVVCDVTKPEDVKNAFTAGETVYGSVDHVIVNAGYEGSLKVSEGWDEDIRKVVDVNILGSVATYLEALESFKKTPQKEHSVIFITSLAATIGYFHGTKLSDFAPHPNIYAMTKAALDSFVRFSAGQQAAKAVEENKKQIRVYGIAPTIYVTEMVHKILDSDFFRSRGIYTPDDYSQFCTLFPGKAGNPIHLARGIAAMIDGTTGWKSGDVLIMDSDASYHSHEHYDNLALVDSGNWEIDRTKVFDVTGNTPYDFEKSDL